MKKTVEVFTDREADLTGKKKKKDSGGRLQGAPHRRLIHCVIHRQAIAAKELGPEVHGVLQDVINVINFIKPRILGSTVFTTLSNKLGSDHETSVPHRG